MMTPGEGNGNHSHVLAWKTSWTEEAGRLQSMGRQESDTTEHLHSTEKHDDSQVFLSVLTLFTTSARFNIKLQV